MTSDVVRNQLLRDARLFVQYARKGAGYDGQGRFNITALRDALTQGISLQEIGITQEIANELEKKVVDGNLQCPPSRIAEIK